MLFHYLRLSLRQLRRRLSITFINVFGLAVSMAVCLLILLFIVDQRQYDRFHPDANRIFRVTSEFKSPGSTEPEPYATSPASLAQLLKSSYPGVLEAARVRDGFRGEMRVNDEAVVVQGLYAGDGFFRLFGFRMLEGNPSTALSEPGALVLTSESAVRLFGRDQNVLGETVTALSDRDYRVTGVVDADVPTHLKFASLVSISTLDVTAAGAGRRGWTDDMSNSYTYVRLEKGAEPRLSEQFSGLIAERFQDPNGNSVLSALSLQQVTSINLGPALANEIGTVIPAFAAWFLVAFAAVIMLIAGFNYVSLTIARGLNRGTEIGVRRIVGAHGKSIFGQFIVESVAVSVVSLLVAIGLLVLLLPQFNSLFLVRLSETGISPGLFANAGLYGLFLAFSLLVGALAGIYPARYFSSLQPVHALSGSRRSPRSKTRLRSIITVTQFAFTIVFIVTTLALFRQFRHMSGSDYGFDPEGVVNVALQDVPYERFRGGISDVSNVERIAASDKVPALGSINGVWIDSDSTAEAVRAHHFSVDPDYIPVMQLKLLAGRNFNPDLASDSVSSAILGRSAAFALRLGNPEQAVGEVVSVSDQPYTVIGVIEDFMSSDPTAARDPIVFRYRPDAFIYAVVKATPGSQEAVETAIQSRWLDLGSLHAPVLKAFSEELAENPVTVVFGDFLRILGLVAFLSLLISCLGLLGMAMFAVRNRVREIGIRKVLGASPESLVLLLSKDYLVLLAIALVLGCPVAWLLNSFWLAQLSNHVALGIAIFGAGVGGTILLAILTIVSQTAGAARLSAAENVKET